MKSVLIQRKADIGKRGIAGFCKGTLEIHTSVNRPVIALNPVLPSCEGAGAVVAVILPGIRIFPDIFKGRNNFKGGAGGIKPLGHPVKQNTAVLIGHQIIPDF